MITSTAAFYSAYDRIEDTTAFEPLRDLVENIYTNEYLETLLPKWNSAMQEPDAFTQLPCSGTSMPGLSRMPRSAPW